MKKGLYAIFTAAVLLLSVTLAAGIAIAGPASAGANEILAPQPKVLDREGKLNDGFLGEAAAWFDDHFFLRQEFISLNNWLSAKLFGVSEAKNVTLGRDGWLYYTPALADYTGTAAMSDGELRDAARNLELMAEFCREEGREFLFAIAPNKSSLYPEHLKGLEPGGGETNAQRLFALLEEKQVPYCDLFRLFREQEETLYFAHDSHWNSRGAALAADGINKAFGRESDYFSGGFTPALHSGDLYEMLYPGFSDGETDMVYSSPWAFSYVGEANRPDSINLLTAGSGKGSLLAYRDSFGNLLHAFLADSFATARFFRATVYDLTRDGHYVLVELVERNLPYLITYAPVMPAPRRDMNLPEPTGTLAASLVKGKNPEGMVRFEGSLERDGGMPVYLISAGQAYEAFLMKDSSFTALLPEEMQPEAVAFYRDGELRLFQVQ